MRERRRLRRLMGTAAAAMAIGVLVTPPVGADKEDWAGSGLTAPSGEAAITERAFPIFGTFHNSSQTITTVEVEFGRAYGDVFEEADDDPCVPEDPGVVPDEPGNGLDRYDFTVETAEGDAIVWPCNGRFRIRALAMSDGLDGPDTYIVAATIVVAVAPPPVETVSATADGAAVRIAWEPVDDGSADALGYRVERAGPKQDGNHGPFVAVSGDLGTDSVTATDKPEVSGDYRYRVLALRRGADEPVTSPAEGSATADVTVTVATTTTTTQPRGDSPAIPSIGSRRAAPRAPRSSGAPQIPNPSPNTTIDTGYQDELDYGDRALEPPVPLADGGEGQSIIRTEGDGAGLVAPAAGALVLLGWAGHVVYLNRLAKQF